MKTRRFLRWLVASLRVQGCLVLLGLAAVGFCLQPQEKQPADLAPIVCPALDLLGDKLVVEGACGDVPSKPGTVEIHIGRVLIGAWSSNTLRVTRAQALPGPRQIISLSVKNVTQDAGELIFDWALEPASEDEMAVLGEAELDLAAAMARAIVVGRELDRDEKTRTIEVVRTLFGNAVRAGQRLRLSLQKPHGLDDVELFQKQPDAVYFLNGIEEDRATAFFYRPAGQEAAIVAAVRRRDSHPVIEEKKDDQTIRRREVLFRGSVLEALGLLGSDRPATIMLGQRRLEYENATETKFLARLITGDLARAVETTPGAIKGLRRLIPRAGDQKTNPKVKRFRPLLDLCLAQLAETPPRPPEPARRRGPDRDRIGEEDQNDANHGLAWLLQQLDGETVHEVYGPKLLRLRDRTEGHVRREVQLALDVCGVEEGIEVERALRRVKGFEPIRGAAMFRHPLTTRAAFSPDGRFLATCGALHVRIWRTSDWSNAATLPTEESVDKMCFSPDARFLYIVPTKGDARRLDWRTGRIDRVYPCSGNEMRFLALSADGRRLVLAWSRSSAIHIFEANTGQLLYTGFSPNNAILRDLTLSPDGRKVVKELLLPTAPAGGSDHQFIIACHEETIEGPEFTSRDLVGLQHCFYSPKGRYLVSLERPNQMAPEPRPWTLRVHDGARKESVVAEHQDARLHGPMAISADGQVLVAASNDLKTPGGGGQISFHVFSMPRLELLAHWDWIGPKLNGPGDLAVSPDGQTLAVHGMSDRGVTNRPWLFETRTGRRILPGGTPGQINHAFFLGDGKTLRTIDDENYACLWDVDTLRLRQRIDLGSAMEIVSIRPRDGKYLLCYVYTPDSDPVLSVVDADTGGIVCSFPKLGKHDYSVVWLNDSHLVLSGATGYLQLDYHRGEVLNVKESVFASHPGFLDWSAGKPGRHRLVEDDFHFFVETLDPEKDFFGVARRIPVQKPSSPGLSGAVPGSRFGYVFGPHFHLIDPVSRDIVVERRFTAFQQRSLCFSEDGSRFAALGCSLAPTGEPGLETICIHDAPTGRLLAVFPSRRGNHKAFLSADGNRMAVVKDDDSLETWDLSELAVF
jgi:WD40 repeat protein